jgi:hypothetical protein
MKLSQAIFRWTMRGFFCFLALIIAVVIAFSLLLSPFGRPYLSRWICQSLSNTPYAHFTFDKLQSAGLQTLFFQKGYFYDTDKRLLAFSPKIVIHLNWFKLLKAQLPLQDIMIDHLEISHLNNHVKVIEQPLKPFYKREGVDRSDSLQLSSSTLDLSELEIEDFKLPILPFTANFEIRIKKISFLDLPDFNLSLLASFQWGLLSQSAHVHIHEFFKDPLTNHTPQLDLNIDHRLSILQANLEVSDINHLSLLQNQSLKDFEHTLFKVSAKGPIRSWLNSLKPLPSLIPSIPIDLQAQGLFRNLPFYLKSSGQLKTGTQIDLSKIEFDSCGWKSQGRGFFQLGDQMFSFNLTGPCILAPLTIESLEIQKPKLSLELSGNLQSFEGALEASCDRIRSHELDETFENPVVWLQLEGGNDQPSLIEISFNTHYSNQPLHIQAKVEKNDQGWKLNELTTDGSCFDFTISPSLDSLQDTDSHQVDHFDQQWHLRTTIDWLKSPFAKWMRKQYGVGAGRLQVNTLLTILDLEKGSLKADFDARIDELNAQHFHAKSLTMTGSVKASAFDLAKTRIDNLKFKLHHLENRDQLIAEDFSWQSWGNSQALFYQTDCSRRSYFELDDTSYHFQSSGLIDLNEKSFRVSIEKIQGQWGSLPVHLKQKASIEALDDAIHIQGLDLMIGAGQLSLDGTLNSIETDLQAKLEHVPVDLFSLITGRSLYGNATGHLNLSLHQQNLSLDSKLLLEHLRVLPPLGSPDESQGEVNLQIKQNQAFIRAALTSQKQNLQFNVTGKIGSVPSWFEISKTPLNCNLEILGQLGLFSNLFTIEDFDFEGLIEGTCHAEGTLIEPNLEGRLVIKNGSYDHYPLGLEMRKIEAEILADHNRMTLKKFECSDGLDGVAKAKGNCSLSPLDSEIDFHLKHFKVLKTSLGTAWIKGEGTFNYLHNHAELMGKFEIYESEFKIPNLIPSPVPQLDAYTLVRLPGENFLENKAVGDKNETSASASLTEALASLPSNESFSPSRPSSSTSNDIRFNLDLKIPSSIFLKGKGLSSAWKGHIHLSGTNAYPLLNGRVEIQQGELNFGGRRFLVKEGLVHFKGHPQNDTHLHVVAELPLDNVTITAMLNGPASHPRLQFKASPALALPDLFSHILFGKSYNSLSAFQALQVAQLALEANGDSSTDVFGVIRKSTGIDRIEIGKKEDGLHPEVAEYTIKVGKYLTESLLVSINKDVTNEAAQVTFELDLTKHFSLIAELGYLSSSSLNLMWKKDY